MGRRLLRWSLLLAGALNGGGVLAGAGAENAATPIRFVSVQATDPLATEPGGNPGAFTIARAEGPIYRT